MLNPVAETIRGSRITWGNGSSDLGDKTIYKRGEDKAANARCDDTHGHTSDLFLPLTPK